MTRKITNALNTPYLMSLFYNMTTVISIVAIDKINNQLHPTLSLLISTLISVLFFNLVNLGHLKKLYAIAYSDFSLTLVINLIIAGLWIGSFYSLYYIDPFSYIFIFSSVPAIISTWIDKKNRIVCSLLAFIFILYLLIVLTHVNHSYIGILCALLSGLFSYLYRKINYFYTKKHQLSASMCLAIRSYGIIFFCIPILLYLHWFQSATLLIYGNYNQIPISILIVTLFSFILPLYLNQKALQNSGVHAHNLITSFIPFMVIFISYFMGIEKTHLIEFKIILSLSFSLFIILSITAHKLRKFQYEHIRKLYKKNKTR
jgi:hypothetical protein